MAKACFSVYYLEVFLKLSLFNASFRIERGEHLYETLSYARNKLLLQLKCFYQYIIFH